MQTDLATVTYKGRALTVEAVEMHGGAIVCSVSEDGAEVPIAADERAALEALFVEARKLTASNAPERVLDADAANTGRRHRGEARTVHSRSPTRRCRPGRAW